MIIQSKSVEIPYKPLEQRMEGDFVAQERGERVIANPLSGDFQAPDQSTDGNWYRIVTVVSSELYRTEIGQRDPHRRSAVPRAFQGSQFVTYFGLFLGSHMF